MERAESIVPLVTATIIAAFLTMTITVPPVSACSLAEPVAPWLQFVISHGLATLNPDCTLTWKTGETTDLNGNLVTSPASVFVQQYGTVFFAAGVALALIGVYLTSRSRRLLKPKADHDSKVHS